MKGQMWRQMWIVTAAALLDPIIILNPPLFAVGGNYSVHIYIPDYAYTNATLILYFRRASNKSFEIYGSRVVGPGEQGGVVTITNATETNEFLCEMEVFFNGRTLRSRSKPVTAIPEALQVRFGPKGSGSDSCYGDAYVNVSGNWAPLCFSSKDSYGFSVAGVICRELGCGRAIDFTPISHTLYTDALPPPKLSVENHDTASRVYVRSTEDVQLQCIFYSPRHEF
ncbi:deleted in malignant brain tumors 1 protein-like, partial [Clarias magur]